MSALDLKARPVTLFYLAVTIFLILVFYIFSLQLFTNAPKIIKLDYLEISPEQTPITIGSAELAQKEGVRAGEKQHIRFIYTAEKGWQAASVARYKKVDAPGGDYKTRYLNRFKLQTGDTLLLKGEEFKVLAAEGKLQLLYPITGQQITWHGGQSGEVTAATTVCAEDKKIFKNWLYPYKIAILDWFADQHLTQKEESLLFKIGGSVTCQRRWGIVTNGNPLLSPDSARVYWLDKGYWLAPGFGRQNLLQIKRSGEIEFTGLDQLYTPLLETQAPVEKLIIGRSSYQVSIDNNQHLKLTQLTGDVWLQEEWQEHVKHLPKSAKNQPQPQMTKAVPFTESAPTLVNGLYLLALATTLILVWQGRLRSYSGLLWTLSLALLFSGNLVLLQLAIGGLNERFLNLSTTFLKISFIYQLFVLFIAFLPLGFLTKAINILFRIKQPYEADPDSYPNYFTYLKTHSHELSFYINSGLNVLLIGYFIMLAMQAVGGLESGVGGYQPVEFSKFIIILISTISAAEYYEKRYLDAYDNQGSILWSLKQTAGLFFWLGLIVLFTAIMLGIVRDFSPIVLIFLYLILFCFRILPHPLDGSFNKMSKIIFGVLVAILSIPAYLLISTKVSGTPPAMLMNADRFQVWANPGLYPHSGSQVIDSMTLISNSNAFGHDRWFAENTSEIMQLPAVQDDFIASFLIYHFGYIPALGLLALQLLLVWQLAHLSNSLLHDHNSYGSALERQIGYSGSLFCYGFAGLLIAHWLISWSNVLGLLPVMGQPMAMLSSGGSNLMLFVVPCFLLSFCFAWIKEQNIS
jgi:cell division protein FtsW (lipid II flippase)